MKKKKILFSSLAAAACIVPLASFICAAKPTSINQRETNDGTIEWKNDDTNWGTLDATGATTKITNKTKFSALQLPAKFEANEDCHFGGWEVTVGEEDPVIANQNLELDPSKGDIVIKSIFAPNVADVSIPKTLCVTIVAGGPQGQCGVDSLVTYENQSVVQTYMPDYEWEVIGDQDVASVRLDRATTASTILDIKKAGTVKVKLNVDNGGKDFTRICDLTVIESQQKTPTIKTNVDQLNLQFKKGSTEEVKDTIEITTDPEVLPSGYTLDYDQSRLDGTIADCAMAGNTATITLKTPHKIGRTLAIFQIKDGDNNVCSEKAVEIIASYDVDYISSIEIEEGAETLDITENDKYTLKVQTKAGDEEEEVDPTYPDALVWESNKPKIVKVSSSGVLTALDTTDPDEYVTITATAVDDPDAETPVSASINVKVSEIELEIIASIAEDKEDLFVGGEVTPSGGYSEGVRVSGVVINDNVKIKAEDITITYGTISITPEISCSGNTYTIFIQPSLLTKDITTITIVVDANEYYKVNWELTNIDHVLMDDVIVTPTGPDTINGTITFAGDYTQLAVDNCFVQWGADQAPSTTKLYGDQAITYNPETAAASFSLKRPTTAPDDHEITVHLTANTKAVWSNVALNSDEYIVPTLSQNTYKQDLIYTYQTLPGYRIDSDEDNTYAMIGDRKVQFGTDDFGINSDGNIQLHICDYDNPVPFDTSILIRVQCVQSGDFDCEVSCLEAHEAKDPEIIQNVRQQDVIAEVYPATNYTVDDDSAKTFVKIFFEDDTEGTITQLKIEEDVPNHGFKLIAPWLGWTKTISKVVFTVAYKQA